LKDKLYITTGASAFRAGIINCECNVYSVFEIQEFSQKEKEEGSGVGG